MIKVLIVDDKAENIYLLESMLDPNGFKTIPARNGAEALGLMRTNIPDLIITDILMPVMDGFTLCRECKKDKDFRNIPFFFYTATYTDSKDEEYAMSLGADCFILKPQEPDVFLKIIIDFLETVKGKKIPPREVVTKPEDVVLKEYNEVLIRKIEDKMVQSEKTEKELRKYSQVLEKEIQEHKKSEKSLQERESHLNSIYQTVGDVIFHIAVEAENRYRFVSVNHAFAIVTGIPEEMVIGKLVNEVIPEPSLSFVLEKYRQAIKENTILRWEEISQYPTGQLFGDVSVAPVVDENGNCTHLVGSVHDITKRKRAEEALLASETKYRQLVTQSPDGIFIVDLSGKFLSVNGSICNRLNYSEEELLGMNLFEIVPEKYHSQHRQRLAAILNGESTSSSVEYEVTGKTGNTFSVEVISVPYYKEKKIIGFQGIARDITERIITTEKLRLAKEKAEESDRLKTAFLHNISHEIRTPMNAIIGFSALLSEPEIDEVSKLSFTDTIIQSSNQLLAIINDIIEISNIEAGIQKYSNDEIEINHVLQSLFDQFNRETAGKGIGLIKETPLPDDEAIIISDKTKFIQVLTNLLNNALKFTKTGRIEFGYKPGDGCLNFYVADTGIGIPEDQTQKIFDRFYQVEQTMARQYEGTGLGLSISKAFVELMGGRIWVDSEIGKGSVFHFTLPYNKPEVVMTEIISDDYEMPFNRPVTILVAEDDDNNFNLIVRFLSMPDITLIRAGNGAEAVKYCGSGQPADLILMDLKMPVMDGYEATRKIKEIRPELKIIAQTAFITEKEKAFDCGCADIIFKPFRKKDLLGIIKKYLHP